MLGVVFEDLLLAFDQQYQGLVNRALSNEAVGIDLTVLAHAADASNGLTFG